MFHGFFSSLECPFPHKCQRNECQLARIESKLDAALAKLEAVERTANFIISGENKIMKTQAEFDTQLESLIVAEGKRDAAVTQALKDFGDKLAGAAVPADLQAEFDKITALQTSAAAITATATADDPGPTTITPPVTVPGIVNPTVTVE